MTRSKKPLVSHHSNQLKHIAGQIIICGAVIAMMCCGLFRPVLILQAQPTRESKTQSKQSKTQPKTQSKAERKTTKASKKSVGGKPIAAPEAAAVATVPDDLVETLLRAEPEKFSNEKLGNVLANAEKYRVQILYTEINRDRAGKPSFKSHPYRLDALEYFYPASTVKFPAVLLALEKVNALRQKLRDEEMTRKAVIEIDSTLPWQHPVRKDTTSADGTASIEHFTKKILLVSDNDGYNRLYEFLGMEYFNEQLAAKGFKHVKITTRLSAGTTNEQNKTTNGIAIYGKGGRTLYSQPATTATQSYDSLALLGVKNLKQGIGSMRDDVLIQEPKDFTGSNYIALETLQELLKTAIFPDAVPAKQRFGLMQDDYEFLLKYMSMLPRESQYPRYDTSYNDGYVKFAMFGDTKDSIPPNIRIFNKVGNAYGYLIENSYIVDFDKNIEFMLSAVIYVNADGIFNDDKYEYDEVGYPFIANLGRTIYKYETERKRQFSPNFSGLKTIVGPEAGYDPKVEALKEIKEIAEREAARIEALRKADALKKNPYSKMLPSKKTGN